ncbi:MAG TPA: hypothetical protein VGJ06_19855 [Candidatus Acidoferrum sp.]|jgi:hypothetical protein
MNKVGQRSAAVTASGVIAILGSLFTAIGVLIGLMGLLVSFGYSNPAATIPGVRAITGAMMVFFLAVAIWGAFSGVGVIRFRNWARISILVWAGITAPICLLVIAVMAWIPLPTMPDQQLTSTLLRFFIIAFYGAPLAIAVWWLILFTRPHIVAQFRPAAAGVSGDPFTAIPVPLPDGFGAAPRSYAVPAPLPASSVPIPIIVLACFFLISSLSIFFIFFMHMPAMVFGHAYTGLTGSVIYATWCLLYAIAGAGMLKRVSWAYSIAIGVQILSIISGIMTVLSPNFDHVMRQAMSTMRVPSVEAYEMTSLAHLRGFSFFGLIFPLAILGMLAYYRPQFLEACASKRSKQTNSSTPSPSESVQPLA